MIVKLARAPKGGGSARGAARYILGYELSDKADAARASYHALIAEAMAREDRGVGKVWSPEAGEGRRPSSILARNVVGLATAAVEMEAVARANPRVKAPVHHMVYSWSGIESKTVTDGAILRAAEAHLDRIGLGDHQAVLTVHRDTENVHVHAAVGAVNPWSLKAWDTTRSHYRLAWAAREVEHERGMAHDRGAAMWDPLMSEVRWAKAHEKAAWRQEDIEQRRDANVARVIGDHVTLETQKSWAEYVVQQIDRSLREAQNRHERLTAADVHLVAERHGARIRSVDGRLEVTLLERVSAEEREAQRAAAIAADPELETREAHGDRAYVDVQTMRSLETLAFPIDEAISTADEEGRPERVRCLSRLVDADAAETEFATMVRADPATIARRIVASGRATFDADDIIAEIAARVSDPDVREELRELTERHESVVMLTADTEQPTYSTREQIDLETRVQAKLERLARSKVDVDRRALASAIAAVEKKKGFQLSREQRDLVHAIASGFSSCQGEAGSGKTTAMEVLSLYGQRVGINVVGFTAAQGAAVKLASEAGIRTQNTAMADVLELGGERTFGDGAIVIYDETSMLDLRAFERGLDRALERGARVLVIGDGAQIGAVSAGATHDIAYDVATKHGRAYHLADVRRQRGELAWMREVVPVLGKAIRERDPDAAADAIKKMQRVVKFEGDRAAAIRAGCAEYVDLCHQGREALLIAGDRLTVRQCNAVVRELRGLADVATITTSEHGRLPFAVNDRVAFGRVAKRLGVATGDRGDVTDLRFDSKTARWTMSVRLDSGRAIDVDTTRYPHLSHGYASTAHRVQSQAVTAAIVVGAGSTDAEVLHSAMTRAVEHLSVYASRAQTPTIDDLADEVAMRMGRKTSAVRVADVIRRTGGPDTLWATRIRRALADAEDPLRREHAAEMRARASRAQRLIAEASARSGAGKKKDARAAARDLERKTKAILRQHEPISFATWAASRQSQIERQTLAEEEARRHQEIRLARERELQMRRDREISQRYADPQIRVARPAYWTIDSRSN